MILKHYDNGAMLKWDRENDKLIVVFPDGSTIKLTEEEADDMWDSIMTNALAAHEGTKQ